MKAPKISLVLLALAGATLAVAAFGRGTVNPRATVIVFKGYELAADGKRTDTYTRTRYIAPNGDMKDVRVYVDGRREEILFSVADGAVYLIGKSKLTALGAHRAKQPHAFPALADGQRADKLLGYDVLVAPTRNGGAETWHAPALNQLLKTTMPNGDGSAVMEAVSIEDVDLPAGFFDKPALPVVPRSGEK